MQYPGLLQILPLVSHLSAVELRKLSIDYKCGDVSYAPLGATNPSALVADGTCSFYSQLPVNEWGGSAGGATHSSSNFIIFDRSLWEEQPHNLGKG